MITRSTLLPDTYFEQEFVVKSVRRYFPASRQEGRKRALVSFFDQSSGGLRTIPAADVIKIR